MATILSLCAGSQDRWEHEEFPKQLAPVRGKPLLERTFDQLAGRARLFNLTVVTHRADITKCAHARGVRTFAPTMHRWTVETLLYCRHLWQVGAIILLGDVFYTDKALAEILTCRKHLAVFGSHEEVFAIVFRKNKVKQVEAALNYVQAQSEWGEITGHDGPMGGKLWHLYRALNDLPLNEHIFEDRMFVEVSDATHDLDTFEQYQRHPNK